MPTVPCHGCDMQESVCPIQHMGNGPKCMSTHPGCANILGLHLPPWHCQTSECISHQTRRLYLVHHQGKQSLWLGPCQRMVEWMPHSPMTMAWAGHSMAMHKALVIHFCAYFSTYKSGDRKVALAWNSPDSPMRDTGPMHGILTWHIRSKKTFPKPSCI